MYIKSNIRNLQDDERRDFVKLTNYNELILIYIEHNLYIK